MTEQPEALPRVTIYSDGGADPNPGPGGWGAVLLHEGSGKVAEISGGEPGATNNRMELTAAIRALEALKQRCAVRFVTDSLYLRKGITEWLPDWVARGWKRKAGTLQNEDLWRRLAELATRHEIRWDWVKGHSGDRWNERADELATAAIRAQRGAAPRAPAAEAEVFLKVSCVGDRGGWAALVRHGGDERTLSGAARGATANALDLLAAAEALEQLPRGIAVAVYTGSDYLRNGAARWLPAWRRGGWKTKEGEPVRNRELWQRLEAALAARRVDWPSVKDAPPAEWKELGKIAADAARGAG